MDERQFKEHTGPERSFRIGTAPVNWNNNDLEGWRPIVPFPDILDEMRSAGYDATEWDEQFGTDIESLNRERNARGMVFAGAYRWLDLLNDDQFERDLEEVRPFLATLRGIGAGDLIVADSLRPDRVAMAGSVPKDGSQSLDDGGYARLANNLTRLSGVAMRFGLKIHYHNHAGTYIETPWELQDLLNHLEGTSVDLCFDTGHHAFGGGDPHAFIGEHPGAFGYIHLKDVDEHVLRQARANRWSFLEALRHYVFCPLGAGCARIADTIELLADSEFPGYVIVEQDTCRGDATENARRNLSAVRGYTGGTPAGRRQEA